MRLGATELGKPAFAALMGHGHKPCCICREAHQGGAITKWHWACIASRKVGPWATAPKPLVLAGLERRATGDSGGGLAGFPPTRYHDDECVVARLRFKSSLCSCAGLVRDVAPASKLWAQKRMGEWLVLGKMAVGGVEFTWRHVRAAAKGSLDKSWWCDESRATAVLPRGQSCCANSRSVLRYCDF